MVVIFVGVRPEGGQRTEPAFAAVVPFRHQHERAAAVGESGIQALRREIIEGCAARAFEFQFGAVGEGGEVAAPRAQPLEGMAHIELDARDARIAGVDFGAHAPADVTRIETELLGVGEGRESHHVAEEVLDALLKRADAEEAALFRVVFEREIVVVGGPRQEARIGHGNVTLDDGGIADLIAVEIRLVDLGVGQNVGEVGAAVSLGVGSADDELVGDTVGEVHARVATVVGTFGVGGPLLVRETQLLQRADSAGLGFADTRAGGVAEERAGGIALPDGGRVDERAGGGVVGLLVTDTGEDAQAIFEEAKLGLRVAGGDDLAEIEGVGDAEQLLGAELGGGF